MRVRSFFSGGLLRTRRGWAVAVTALVVVGASAAVGLGTRDVVTIPQVVEHGPGNPPDSAIFSHWQHGDFTCSSCHPSVFPMAKKGFTHAEMRQGRYCGSCHDGQVAFSPKDKGVECELCHVPTSSEQIDADALWD